jgi:hypothetical protein
MIAKEAKGDLQRTKEKLVEEEATGEAKTRSF